MSKVKTKSVFIYKRSSLLNMTSKYSTKCFLKQMVALWFLSVRALFLH